MLTIIFLVSILLFMRDIFTSGIHLIGWRWLLVAVLVDGSLLVLLKAQIFSIRTSLHILLFIIASQFLVSLLVPFLQLGLGHPYLLTHLQCLLCFGGLLTPLLIQSLRRPPHLLTPCLHLFLQRLNLTMLLLPPLLRSIELTFQILDYFYLFLDEVDFLLDFQIFLNC